MTDNKIISKLKLWYRSCIAWYILYNIASLFILYFMCDVLLNTSSFAIKIVGSIFSCFVIYHMISSYKELKIFSKKHHAFMKKN